MENRSLIYAQASITFSEMINPYPANRQPSVKSYYYLDKGIVEGLMSQLDALPPLEVVATTTQQEKQSVQTGGEDRSSLSLSFGSNAKIGTEESQTKKEETALATDSGSTTMSKYGVGHLFGLAIHLEELIEKFHLSEDFNRRLEEVINNWQKEVETFSKRARDSYDFDNLDSFLTGADNHIPKLVNRYIDNFKTRLIPNLSSRLLNIRARNFKWSQESAIQNRFSFTGRIGVQVKLSKSEHFYEVCCVRGSGQVEFLDSSARGLASEGKECDLVEILGKYQGWSDDNHILIQPILIS